jgi:hypothetical protein
MDNEYRNVSFVGCTDLVAALLTLGYDIASKPNDPSKLEVRASKVLGKKDAKGNQKVEYSFKIAQDGTEFNEPAADIIAAWEAERDFTKALDNQLLALKSIAQSTGNPDAVRAVNNTIKLLPLALAQYCRNAAKNRIGLVTWVIKNQRENAFQTSIVEDDGNGRVNVYDARMKREDIEALRNSPLPKRTR